MTKELRRPMHGLIITASEGVKISEEHYKQIEQYLKQNLFKMFTGIELIALERQEQIEVHGRTIDQDVEQNDDQQLTKGAMMLLSSELTGYFDPGSYPDGWDLQICPNGWDLNICDHMLSKSYAEKLVIAGALIAADLDRLNRTETNEY